MRIITVSREYGAGGEEVGKRLAEDLGWKLLDRELLHQAAAVEHVPDAELESLDEQAIGVAERFRLHPPHNRYIHGLKQVVDRAVAQGNVILVGRGTNQLVGNREGAFHVRLVAPRPWRAQRMAELEGWTQEQSLARCTEVDRTRERFHRYFFGAAATQLVHYDLVLNTGRVRLDDVVAGVAALVRQQWPSGAADSSAQRRVMTLTGELGAGDSSMAATLAQRLKLSVFDRELLAHEARRLGVSLAELELVDERPAGIFQRFRPGSLHQRCFETLGQLMGELAAQGMRSSSVAAVAGSWRMTLGRFTSAWSRTWGFACGESWNTVGWQKRRRGRSWIRPTVGDDSFTRHSSAWIGRTLLAITSRSTPAAWGRKPWT